MGRKATPPGLKLIQGTKRKDREPPKDVPQFEQVREFPDPPDYLNVDGVKVWNELGPQLVAAGVLQVVDLYSLGQLCYGTQRFIQKARAGMDITASEDNALAARYSDFGMTPAARRRVAANLADDKHVPKANAFAGIGRKPA